MFISKTYLKSLKENSFTQATLQKILKLWQMYIVHEKNALTRLQYAKKSHILSKSIYFMLCCIILFQGFLDILAGKKTKTFFFFFAVQYFYMYWHMLLA